MHSSWNARIRLVAGLPAAGTLVTQAVTGLPDPAPGPVRRPASPGRAQENLAPRCGRAVGESMR